MLYKFDGTLFFDANDEQHAFKRLAEHFQSLSDGGCGIDMHEDSDAYLEQAEHVDVFEQFDAGGSCEPR